MAQANTAGHTKKTVQYSILYIGYALGEFMLHALYSLGSVIFVSVPLTNVIGRKSHRTPNLPC